MIDESKVVIRPMRDGEEKEIVKMGRKAFQLMEALFVGAPKQAMVAEYNGTLVGSMSYKNILIANKKIAYLDQGFIDPNFAGFGIGKKLYTHTIRSLWSKGYQVVTALVKDDNIGSWKLLAANQLKRVSCYSIIKEIGVLGFIKLYCCTPFLITVGMDFYMATDMDTVNEKNHAMVELLSFFAANILLLLPLWIRVLTQNRNDFLWTFLAYITILFLFISSRYIGHCICKTKGIFRLNNGGSFLPLLLSLGGNVFLMNGNWYPENYENTNVFKRKLAIPELIKWAVFLVLPILSSMWTEIPYWNAVGKFSCVYLIFMCIPVYPFESLGGGRVYNYNKQIWLFFLFLTVLEFLFIFIR